MTTTPQSAIGPDRATPPRLNPRSLLPHKNRLVSIAEACPVCWPSAASRTSVPKGFLSPREQLGQEVGLDYERRYRLTVFA